MWLHDDPLPAPGFDFGADFGGGQTEEGRATADRAGREVQELGAGLLVVRDATDDAQAPAIDRFDSTFELWQNAGQGPALRGAVEVEGCCCETGDPPQHGRHGDVLESGPQSLQTLRPAQSVFHPLHQHDELVPVIAGMTLAKGPHIDRKASHKRVDVGTQTAHAIKQVCDRASGYLGGHGLVHSGIVQRLDF